MCEEVKVLDSQLFLDSSVSVAVSIAASVVACVKQSVSEVASLFVSDSCVTVHVAILRIRIEASYISRSTVEEGVLAYAAGLAEAAPVGTGWDAVSRNGVGSCPRGDAITVAPDQVQYTVYSSSRLTVDSFGEVVVHCGLLSRPSDGLLLPEEDVLSPK
ncbi:hypothetical protein CYMTET_11177 [Cymbomonas tetramitiformis]|uniref:Uncharacterized protein n=1 Tax=Cymbomonas tetramitiformis TaxID=36881 RepID=A0AAE0LDQ9_9CHLO|nr:hypothetical protein CYMTET_11177 [Cymbomonas tetramitiformis]